VERVVEARIDVLVGERRTDFQDTVRPLPLDSEGFTVEGVQVSPQLVVVSVPVHRTSFARQVGVQPVVDEQELDASYELRSIETQPAAITLTGPQAELENAPAYLVTAPISLTNHYSDFTVDAPLIVPSGLAAMNDRGEMIRSVKVKIGIAPVTGYLVVEREVMFLNQPAEAQVHAEPSGVAVLLIGPQTLLEEIAREALLVRAEVDLADLSPGTYTLPVRVVAPEGVQVQVFPADVLVVIE
jgi:YbbR domain-containing protein